MPGQRRKKVKAVRGKKTQRRGRRATRAKCSSRGRRYSDEFKKDCLKLVAGGMTKVAVREKHGPSVMTLSRWEKELGLPEIDSGGTKGSATKTIRKPSDGSRGVGETPRAPHDNVAGLSQNEIDTVLALKKEHFTMGPAQIRAQLKRFHGWRLSVKAIARVLKAHGYSVEHKSARDELELMRFEAPRPNALWMMDALSFRVHEQRLYLHLALDDFSRFIVGHRVSEEVSSDEAVETLKEAIARHGKPERLLTDRGGQFLAVRSATAFRRFLESELIDHSVSRPYHPQTLGKVESVNRAIQKELLYVHELRSAAEAKARISAWVSHFNFHRAHLGIEGLVPADRYFGLHQRALADVQARSRGRLATAQGAQKIGAPLDDLGGPLELLRLVFIDGAVEMRFCGLRVVLGKPTI